MFAHRLLVCPELVGGEINVPSVRVMALELALRFMTDYLDGDRYFHISRPGHNLDRARNQMKLLEDIEAKFDKMQEILRTIVK